MTSNYDQLKSKAEQVVSAHEDFRNKTRLLEHTEREYQQALANVARTEAEYTLRKDQSDFSTSDFDELTARKIALEGQVTTLRTAYTTLRNVIETATTGTRDLVTTKKSAINTLKGVKMDLPLIPVSTGLFLLEEQAEGFRDTLEEKNTNIIYLREQEDQVEAELKTLEALLAELEAQRDSYPTGSAPPSLLAQITNVKDVQIGTDTGPAGSVKLQLYQIRNGGGTAPLDVGITQTLTDISSATNSLNAKEGEIATTISQIRTAQSELVTLEDNHQNAIKTFEENYNKLQDIDGTDVDVTVVPLPVLPTLVPPTPTSELGVVKEIHTQMTTVPGLLDAAELAAKDARDEAVSDLPGAKSTRDNKKGELDIAQNTLTQREAELRVLVDKQKDIEVKAAVALLEDFLKNENTVLASAPNVALSVQTEVDKTCPSSKVQELIFQIRAAYSDEDEYKALLEQIVADPFPVFFNTIEDPCFLLLTESEVAQFRAEVESRFRAAAQELLVKYGHGVVSSTSTTNWTTLLIILFVVLLVAALAFLYVR